MLTAQQSCSLKRYINNYTNKNGYLPYSLERHCFIIVEHGNKVDKFTSSYGPPTWSADLHTPRSIYYRVNLDVTSTTTSPTICLKEPKGSHHDDCGGNRLVFGFTPRNGSAEVHRGRRFHRHKDLVLHVGPATPDTNLRHGQCRGHHTQLSNNIGGTDQ